MSSSSKHNPAAAADMDDTPRQFEPTAATASAFLYTQGSVVVCCRHDTLKIERTFLQHNHEIRILIVDMQSEAGSGRLAMTYDANKLALVWDITNGDEIARFEPYEPFTVAAWMRNGNVAFGDKEGVVTVFDPRTAEHVCARTLNRNKITALAPAADCKTFAIGYDNGSLLIATLQPRFTILHTLTTSRAPSPIVTLAWHASASKQKSDMIATQTLDGDLRVWSIAKGPSNSDEDSAKVVRILKRNETYTEGSNWMGWSKNGRIIQFSDRQTLSWDVRTKHVTFDAIPTIEGVKGIAVHGPGATLFTLGPNNSVQQYDLNTPSIMVANIQHPPSLLPPSPPVSIEEQNAMSSQGITSMMNLQQISDSDDQSRYRAYGLASPQSVQTASSQHYQQSLNSYAYTDGTFFSGASSVRTPQVYAGNSRNYQTAYREKDARSTSSRSYTSSTRSSNRSGHKPSKLRIQLSQQASPAVEPIVKDLFKYTGARLSDMTYRHPTKPEGERTTNDSLRRQMLTTIFSWEDDINALVLEELSRHPSGSSSGLMLSKWLGQEDVDFTNNLSSSDWMLLALSGSASGSSQHKVGRAYVQHLLLQGDVHAAATIMISLGDHNDAIEMYISHKKFMEALILTCLRFPLVWERQAAIIRKWGENAIQHGQEQLAIRCFACTDMESSDSWASPSAMQLNFNCMTPSIPNISTSPPAVTRGPTRSLAKIAGLKLITTFDDAAGTKTKFFGDTRTPLAAGVTPIESAVVSPRSTVQTTAILRPSANSRFNTPMTAKPAGRLSSIGEASGNMSKENLRIVLAEHAAAMASKNNNSNTTDETPLSPLSTTALQPISANAQDSGSPKTNGSRSRMPRDLTLSLQQIERNDAAIASAGTNDTRYHWPSRFRGPSSAKSASVSGSVANSTMTRSTAKSVRTPGSANPEFIHSLDAAQEYSESIQKDSRGRNRSRSQDRQGENDRGRPADRSWSNSRRSPTSPKPMSPQEFKGLSAGMRLPTATYSNDNRQKSLDRQPRSNSAGRSQSRVRQNIMSPVSPQPMIHHFQSSEDENEFQKALEEKENWRNKRSTSRTRSRTPGSARPTAVEELEAAVPAQEEEVTLAPQVFSPIEKPIEPKSVRDIKKAEAAKALEERRLSLALKAQTSLSVPSSTTMSPPPLPSSAGSEQNRSTPRTMFAHPNGAMIGLPASPKAMRLIYNSEIAKVIGQPPSKPVPQPPQSTPGGPEPADVSSLTVTLRKPDTSTLLPSTVYKPSPSAATMGRSLSAPPTQPFSGAAAAAVTATSPKPFNDPETKRAEPARKEEPAPPLLPQLQHLAGRGANQRAHPPPPLLLQRRVTSDNIKTQQPLPPPPPPMPLHRYDSAPNSSTIKVLHDEDTRPVIEHEAEPAANTHYQLYSANTKSGSAHATPDILSAHTFLPVRPATTEHDRTHSHGHSRGRSVGIIPTFNSNSGVESIGARISKATTRLRSQSRTRRDPSAGRSTEPLPYESVPPPSVPFHRRDTSTGSLGNMMGPEGHSF